MTLNLVRTGPTGATIHRDDCQHVTQIANSTAQPWVWANGRELPEIRNAVAMIGAHPCKNCKPLTEPS